MGLDYVEREYNRFADTLAKEAALMHVGEG